MVTHVTFFRPSTTSSVVIEVPFEVHDDPHLDERFILWTIEEYPDWIPKAYLMKDNYASED